MAIDKNSPKRPLTRIDDSMDYHVRPNLSIEEGDEQGGSVHPMIRLRPASRPPSFLHVLENFQEETLQVTPSPSTSHFSAQTDESIDRPPSSLRSSILLSNDSGAPSLASPAPMSAPPSISSPPRIEDTVRRQKRFSLPVVGLQTTPVTARANTKGEGLAKRFSLVLGGGRTVRGSKSPHVRGQGLDGEPEENTIKQSRSTGHGVAAARLADLLGRRKM
jgi:FYVE/RhoGEF/PH domain-containing protein 5/6